MRATLETATPPASGQVAPLTQVGVSPGRAVSNARQNPAADVVTTRRSSTAAPSPTSQEPSLGDKAKWWGRALLTNPGSKLMLTLVGFTALKATLLGTATVGGPIIAAVALSLVVGGIFLAPPDPAGPRAS